MHHHSSFINIRELELYAFVFGAYRKDRVKERPGECHTIGFASGQLHKTDHQVRESILLYYTVQPPRIHASKGSCKLIKFQSIFFFFLIGNFLKCIITLQKNSPKKKLQCPNNDLLNCMLDLWYFLHIKMKIISKVIPLEWESQQHINDGCTRDVLGEPN
jgi:hypothetical protein